MALAASYSSDDEKSSDEVAGILHFLIYIIGAGCFPPRPLYHQTTKFIMMNRKEFIKKGLMGTGMFAATAALGNVI